MVLWACSCGNEFDAPNVDVATCPKCGRELDNDPEITRNIFRDCGYDEDYVMDL